LEDLYKHHPDQIIVAGDMVVGPNSVEVLRQLRESDCWMIRGNNEEYLLRFDSGQAPDWWVTSRQFSFVRWVYEHMDKASLDYIRSLPVQRLIELDHTDSVRLVHGSPRNPEEHLYPGYSPEPLEAALSEINEPVLACGHTHIPWGVNENGRLAFNPGAVCGSINGNPDAHYALLDWYRDHWEVTHHTVPFDKNQFRKACFESGLMEAGYPFSRVFTLTVETGQNVVRDFLPFAYKMAEEAGYPNCEYVPDDILEDVIHKFPWDRYEQN